MTPSYITSLKEHLMELPLFQGMSKSDIDEVIATTKFTNLSIAKGKIVINENDISDKIYFLTNGSICSTKKADDGGYQILEKFSLPNILQPERIFGLTPRYTRTFKTFSKCDFICLDKEEVLRLSDNYQIFRINLLNIISTRSQRLTALPWKSKPKTIRQKIVLFIEERCLRPAGEKILSIKMERLAQEISQSRLNVSKELNSMDKEGLIILNRGQIIIPSLEKLINKK